MNYFSMQVSCSTFQCKL